MSDLREHGRIEAGSDRQFGLVIGAVLLLFCLWPVLRGEEPRYWLGAAAVALGAVALVRPRLLHSFNILWHRFGLLLGRVAAPVVMGLVFFVGITPMAQFFRLRGKDLLDRRPDSGKKSYWIDRDQSVGPMTNQF